MSSIRLDIPLSAIAGIGPRFTQKLKKLHIETVGDLLWHFPARYEDFSRVYNIAELEPGQQATIQGVVEDINVRHTWHKHLTIVEACIADDTGNIRAVWFNQPYIKNLLRPGRIANFSGKVSLNEGELFLSHPTYELTGSQETKHTARLVPVYPETRGLTSKGLRFIMKPILDNLEFQKEWIPKDILKKMNLPDINHALKSIHFPDDVTDASCAKERFAFEDLFLLQIANLKQKVNLAKEKAPPLKTDIEWLKNILEKLPFPLTTTQKRSLWEVIKDIEKGSPMNRLLQGDVGSGKTVVAALAGLIAHKNGGQTAIMTPTEVLARQHFETFKKLFRSIPREDQPVMALVTSGESKIFYENDVEVDSKKNKVAELTKKGELNILIGTHSLIAKSKGETLNFKNLSLVIIDEQHRFGVEQRASLLKKKSLIPHFLSMSATPIPRTLMMTIFGDLDISTITELPAGRKPIVTKVVMPLERQNTYDFIREKIKEGRQAFVICPRIEPGEEDKEKKSFEKKLELKSVKEEFERLSKQIFPDLKIEMLHGQMKPKEKEKVMREFSAKGGSASGGKNKIDILVSTSVIEVGVDIPNAAIMMIEGADRFGLAQLYQFRGRVGRGEHQSYCFLFTDSGGKETEMRLKAILEARNGFELAERDLEIRGPGEFLGSEQTGLPDIAMENLQNVELVRQSREAAKEMIKKSPTLAAFPMLKNKLSEFENRLHLE